MMPCRLKRITESTFVWRVEAEAQDYHSTLTLFASDSSEASLWDVAPNSGVFRFVAVELFETLKFCDEVPLAFDVGSFSSFKTLEFAFGVVFRVSSLRKLGPEPTTGVAKFRGLGSVLLSPPRKFQSG
jgi:hypothetical protein